MWKRIHYIDSQLQQVSITLQNTNCSTVNDKNTEGESMIYPEAEKSICTKCGNSVHS